MHHFYYIYIFAGAGKSTTIHFLAGLPMIESYPDDMYHIGPDPQVLDSGSFHPALKLVTSSPETRSETRSVTAVPISYQDMGLSLKGTIVLCDTPGFQDTEGPAVDIANGIGLVLAVKQARSVRPVVLFSDKSMGDRLESLIPLAMTLTSFIQDLNNNLPAFSYLFTKYSEKEAVGIHGKLKNKEKHLNAEQKSDPSFVMLLSDIIKKTQGGTDTTKNTFYYTSTSTACSMPLLDIYCSYYYYHYSYYGYIYDRTTGATVLDPLKDDPSKYLEDFSKLAAITEPNLVFSTFVSTHSMQVLKSQMAKHSDAIRQAMNRFTSMYLLIYLWCCC